VYKETLSIINLLVKMQFITICVLFIIAFTGTKCVNPVLKSEMWSWSRYVFSIHPQWSFLSLMRNRANPGTKV